MVTELPPEVGRRARVHAALADPGRLAIVDRLLWADASPSELQAALGMPSNLVAHHVGVLEGAGVLRRTRSEGDRRRTYLQMIPEALDALVPSVAREVQRVVFVCSRNSARSQLAVAVWNRRSSLAVASAGTHPAAEVHPRAVAAARRHDLQLQPQVPQHVDAVVLPTDLVIAVCDNAHEELSPDSRRLHWSIPDPAKTADDEAFDRVVDDLIVRIDRLVPTVQPQ